jgi:hypothetical protein
MNTAQSATKGQGVNYLARLQESWAVAPQTPVSYVCSICYRSGGRVKYFGSSSTTSGSTLGTSEIDYAFHKRLYKAAVAHLDTVHGKRLKRNRMGRWLMVATNEQGVK